MHVNVPPTAAALAWVAERAGGAAILATEVLTGGSSHSNLAITLGQPDGRRVVLRRWVRADWRERDPDLSVEREVAALLLLERAAFAAPRLIAADPVGERCGTPAILMTCLPGGPASRNTVLAARSLDQLASAALDLHRIPGPWPGIPDYRPYNDLRDPRPPRRSTRSDLWERAFDVLAGTPPTDRAVFIHRDYHPGNTLWLNETLTGVVDWTTASRGPVGVDLGHMRWNLVLDHGDAAAERFLERYCSSSDGGYEHHPYWDLRCLVDLLPDDGSHDRSDVGPGDGSAAGLAGAQLARLEPYLERILAQC